MKRMRMFLSTVLAAVVLMSACAYAADGFTKKEIETLDASVPFDAELGQISVTSVDEKPMLAPADMTEEQRAVMIALSMPLALLDDWEERGVEISAEFFLLSAAGLFKPGAVTRMAGEGGFATVNLIIAIPRDSALEEYRLIFNGQARTLVFADDDERIPTRAEDDAAFTAGGGEDDTLRAFVGDWAGSVDNINLSFTVNPDGTGLYAFEQGGYTERYDVALSAASETFAVDIPADNELGSVTCEGTYQYADGTLTLGVRTTFKGGRVFEYTIPCRRVEASHEPPVVEDGQPQAGTSVPSDEAEADPTVEPGAEPDLESTDDMEEAVAGLLSELARSEDDPWRLAIYEAGAQDVARDGEALSFALRSFNPGLGDRDKSADLDELLRNAGAYDLEIKLGLKDGAIEESGKKAIRSAVSKAASASKAAFDRKSVRIAIAQRLLSANGHAEYAPLFEAQAKQSLSVDGGPHALSLRCSGANPEALLEAARAEVYARFAKQAYANRSGHDAIREALLTALAERAERVRKKPDEEFTLTLDVDRLAAGKADDLDDYLGRYAFDEVLGMLFDQVADLPDAPALDFPKSGRLSGSAKGTKVILKIPDDGQARYIQLRDDDSGELAVSCFIRPGSSCTVRVPKGRYYILVASGATWYGEEALFGGAGTYSRTQALDVLGGNYYHTVTLGGVRNGNMSSYGANPSDFI